MNNQTNDSNGFGQDDNQTSRPLTSFLQAKQNTRLVDEPVDDESTTTPHENPVDEKADIADDPEKLFGDSLVGADEDNYEDKVLQPDDNNKYWSPDDEKSADFNNIEEPANNSLADDSNDTGVSFNSASLDDSYKDNQVQPTGGAIDSVVKSGENNNKIDVALKALRQMQNQINTVIDLLQSGSMDGVSETLNGISNVESAVRQSVSNLNTGITSALDSEGMTPIQPIDGRVVEGVFDGRGMVGSDGKSYLVPPNYASKSKLVEGDMLKLTITPKGSFIYKQIGPIERSRLIGTLSYDQTIGEFYVTTENRRWNVLKASVTYFKGDPGDEVVLLVPKNAPSKWAAVENIIKRNPFA